MNLSRLPSLLPLLSNNDFSLPISFSHPRFKPGELIWCIACVCCSLIFLFFLFTVNFLLLFISSFFSLFPACAKWRKKITDLVSEDFSSSLNWRLFLERSPLKGQTIKGRRSWKSKSSDLRRMNCLKRNQHCLLRR